MWTRSHKEAQETPKSIRVSCAFFVTLLRRRSGCRCGNRILTVEVGHESARDVDACISVEQRDPAGIDNHGDAARLGKSLEAPANLFLDRAEELLLPAVVS